MEKIKLEIPDVFTIRHYERFNEYEHLSDVEKIIKVVSVITDQDEEFVKTWDILSIGKIYKDLNDRIANIDSSFMPLFEFGGILYGFNPIHKMTGGQYYDLDLALKEKTVSLAKFMSMVYRPVKKNNLGSFEWQIKSGLKYAVGKSDDLFKWYELEPYDSNELWVREQEFQNLPIDYALGAYSFFLLIALNLYKSTVASSQEIPMEMRMMMEKTLNKALSNFMAGSQPFID